MSSSVDFSCTVRLWYGEYTIRLQHLKPFNYLESECQQMQEISDACGGLRLRIHRLREEENLEEAARAVLKHLGELKRPAQKEIRTLSDRYTRNRNLIY